MKRPGDVRRNEGKQTDEVREEIVIDIDAEIVESIKQCVESRFEVRM